MNISREHDDGLVPTVLEAQGLAWLVKVMINGGVRVVPVINNPGWLEELRLTATAMTPTGAEAFGRALAVTYVVGAPAFRATPPRWDSQAQMGRSDIRLRPYAIEEDKSRRWGGLYVEDRILPYLQPSRDNGSISMGGVRIVERLCERLRDGNFDTDQPALVRAGAHECDAWVAVARMHGNPQCGDVLWTPADEAAQWALRWAGLGSQELDPWQAPMNGAAGGPTVVGMLIDPMAQDTYAEIGLTALGMPGQRYLDCIYATCHEVSPLAEGWRERVGLHSWRIIMIHIFPFDGGYGRGAITVARQYL